MMVYILEQIGNKHNDGQHLGLFKKRSIAEQSKQKFTIQQHVEAYIKTYPILDKDYTQVDNDIYELQFKDDIQCMSIGFYASEDNAWKAKEYYMKKALFANKEDALLILTHHL